MRPTCQVSLLVLVSAISQVTSQAAGNANAPSQVVTDSSSDGVTTSQIVGAAVGSAGAVIICLLVCLCYRYYRTEEDGMVSPQQIDDTLQQTQHDAVLTKMTSLRIYQDIADETEQATHVTSHSPPPTASAPVTAPVTPTLLPSRDPHIRNMSIPSTIHSAAPSQISSHDHDKEDGQDEKHIIPSNEATILTRHVASDEMV